MTAADRLNEIQKRADKATDGPWEKRTVRGWEMAVSYARTDVPRLVSALRAVLDLHQFYDQCDEGCCRYCESCEHEWPCPTAVAIEAALGEVQR